MMIKKTIILLLIVTFIILGLSRILEYKFVEKINDARKQVLEMEENSVDVLFVGASGLYAGISPINLWGEFGVTSFNLSSSNQSPLISYYSLLEVLQKHKPKVIVLDLVSLGIENTPQEYESYYQNGLSGFQSYKIRYSALFDMFKTFKIEDKLSFISKFYRYHNRWNQLSEKDFVDNKYEAYRLGGLLNSKVEPVSYLKSHMDNTEKVQPNFEQSEYYYSKIIELAKENNIEIISVSPPRLGAKYGRQKAIEDFTKKNEIINLDLSTKESIEMLNLDFSKDFYNNNHLNKYGNYKLTKYIGKYLTDEYDLQEGYDDGTVKYWNNLYEEYINAEKPDYLDEK